MIKITFAEKNNLIVKHQDGNSFYKDLELFKKHFPGHTLNTELAMANQFSVERLDGQMLNILLDEVEIKEILDNRSEIQPEAEPAETTATTETTAEVTETSAAPAEATQTTEATEPAETPESKSTKAKATETNKKKGQKTKSSPK